MTVTVGLGRNTHISHTAGVVLCAKRGSIHLAPSWADHATCPKCVGLDRSAA